VFFVAKKFEILFKFIQPFSKFIPPFSGFISP